MKTKARPRALKRWGLWCARECEACAAPTTLGELCGLSTQPATSRRAGLNCGAPSVLAKSEKQEAKAKATRQSGPASKRRAAAEKSQG
jgi:hypothetical protein